MSVVFEPLGGDLGNGIVLLWFPLRNASEGQWVAFSHGFEQVRVDIFLQACGFLYSIHIRYQADSVTYLGWLRLGHLVIGFCGIW